MGIHLPKILSFNHQTPSFHNHLQEKENIEEQNVKKKNGKKKS